jgi:hypothetical protein
MTINQKQVQPFLYVRDVAPVIQTFAFHIVVHDDLHVWWDNGLKQI